MLSCFMYTCKTNFTAMFEFPLERDNSPIDNTDTTTIQLFYSTKESREFKELCKLGMMHMYSGNIADANVSDFLLHLLRLYQTTKL